MLSPTSPQGRALSPSIRSRGQSPQPSAAASPSLHGVDDLPSKDYSHLLRPENFHPLPSTTIPAPFLNSPHQPSQSTPIPELLRNGHFRAAAISSALTLTTGTDPTDAQTIFNLLHTRLSCLILLNQQALAAQEVKCLGDLTSTFYRHPLTGEHAVPWDLRVLAIRLNALGFGEWRRGIMAYYELAREARSNVVKAAGEETDLWKSRLHELGIRVANALVEMGDFEGAGKHLATLDRGNISQEIREMEVLVWLRVGDLTAAKRCLSTADEDASSRRSLEALALMADADYQGAADVWQLLREERPGDWLPVMNAAICSLYTGHMDEVSFPARKAYPRRLTYQRRLARPSRDLSTTACHSRRSCSIWQRSMSYALRGQGIERWI